MHASATKVTRPFQPAFEAAGTLRRARRNRYRLRRSALFVASGVVACCRALLWALQDARSREAARVMARYRHLRQDVRHTDDRDSLNRGVTDARQIKSKEN